MAVSSELDQMIQNGRGKSHAFAEALVRQYYTYIHRLAVSVLGETSEADDICQETFIDALLYIDRYSPGTNLRAWLSKIAVHKCQALLRRRKIRSSWEKTIKNIQNIFKNSASETLLRAEENKEIWSVVNSLTDKQRIPVILYYIYDYKIREIAVILDIPEGTVSSRLYHAVQKLSAYFQDRQEE